MSLFKRKLLPMSLQGYLLGLKISTLFAFSAWASVVLYIDPESAGIFGKALFFVTFFLWLSGVCTLVLTWIQRKIFGEDKAAALLGSNMRQSIFLSCLFIVLLTLQYFKVFALWNGMLIGVAFLLIELYFAHRATKDDIVQVVMPKLKPQYSRLKHKKVV